MTAVTLLANPLREGWSLSHTGGDAPATIAGVTIDAVVPGTTHVDLLRAGLIEDPYYGTVERDLQWMWRSTWRYATDFAATEPTAGERVDLVFDGLDTVATVSLNGTELGRTFNMHRSYRFDVREALVAGSNSLHVDFGSALEYAFAREEVLGDRPRPQPSEKLMAEAARLGIIEGDPDEILAKGRVYPQPFNAIRKMACSFGWDWGPDLQTAGIWKGVRIERWRVARLASVRPLVTVEGTTGVATVHVEIERASDVPLSVYATVAGVEAKATVASGETTATIRVEVPNAALWWPVGYGEPALHGLVVDLHSADEHLDSFSKRIGFRSIQIDREGGAFTFLVNGERVFVKGANWIPDDHLMTRITRERLERRVDQALAANMNLLRIWGGGIYETDDFYDVCDERGVMVWQDFLFACAAYAEDAETVAEVEAEVRENVTRLASHASLVIYNGSNENVWGWWDWGWQQALAAAGLTDWGQKYYEEVLPGILAELDPTRPYTPSSPFSTHPYDDSVHPNDPSVGTVHEWTVWNQVDYTHYADAAPRFCSEFGFQGPATWATMLANLPPEGFDKTSDVWLAHQKADRGNDKLLAGYVPHLPDSDDFETWHWITSLNQARAIEFGIAHYRSWWPHTAGAIVWQLNDCWPVTSWAAIDGEERPKPLYYALKKVFAPRLLTFQPRGADGGLDVAGAAHLIAVNDTDGAWSETLTFTRMALDGTELAVATAHLSAGPRETVTLDVPAHVLEAGDAAGEILVADAGYPGDDDHVRAVWTFAEDKDIAYKAAPFTAAATKVDGGYRIEFRATGFVRDLTVLVDKVDPSAVADVALLTLVPEDRAVVTIASANDVDPEAFLAQNVLVSVNSLVAGAR
jgi:beta-mannosidase